MSAPTTTATTTRPLGRRKDRLLGVAGAAAAALAIWSWAELLGMNVVAPGFGGEQAQDIDASDLVLSAARCRAVSSRLGIEPSCFCCTRRSRPC